MSGIRNIIFDLGGVLLNVDYHRTSKAFKALGVAHFDDLYSQTTADRFFESLETGELAEEKFYTTMQQHTVPNTSAEQVRTAWNEILLDFRESSLEHLRRLSEKYRLYLLSNTNAIHLAAFNKTLQKQTGESSLDNYFTKSYYSHVMRRRKPYPETYTWVLQDAGILPEETLFIDDSINNIEGAKEAGLQTYLLKPGERIEDLNLL